MMKQIRAYREYMNLALITAGISFSAFYVAKIDTLLYLPIVAVILGILLVNYPVKKNRRFFQQAGIVLFVNLAVYTIVKFLQCGVVPLRMLHLAYIVYGLSLLKILWDCRDNGQIGERAAEQVVGDENGRMCEEANVQSSREANAQSSRETNAQISRKANARVQRAEKGKSDRHEQGQENAASGDMQNRLFRERRWDLERLTQLLEAGDLIGMDAPWGSGKTFLIRSLEKRPEIAEHYAFIEINLLTCNLDEIQEILLSELEKFLARNGIFSRYSRRLKGFLGEKGGVFAAGSVLMDGGSTFSETIMGLRQEIFQSGKRVVVVYEDMDRVGDGKVIREILSIAENMAAGGVKTIFQYDEERLREIDESFDHEYLRKFIHYTMQLSEISFSSGISYLLKVEGDWKWIEREDFQYLETGIRIDDDLQRLLPGQHNFRLQVNYATIRNIQQFLQEIEFVLENEPLYRSKEGKRGVITFFLIKHFMYDLYQTLDRFRGEHCLLDVLTMEHEGKSCTILEVMNSLRKKDGIWKAEQAMEMLWKEENRRRFAVISLFGYSLGVYGDEKMGKIGELTDDILQKNKRLEENEWKDRLIQNLLWAGYSGRTDQKNAVALFRKYVLDRSESEWKKGYQEFWNCLYWSEFEKVGNQTIFHIAYPCFTDLFRAFWMAGASETDWIGFLTFYFQYEEVKTINAGLIENLIYCRVESRRVYLFVLEHFNDLQIVGNFNQLKSYRLFLKRYLQALSRLQYIYAYEAEGLELGGDGGIGDEYAEFVQKGVVEAIARRLKKEAERLDKLPALQEDVQIILRFLHKNAEIIACEKTCSAPEPDIRVETSSRFIHQEELERLRDLDFAEGEEGRWTEMDKSYQEEKIGMQELLELVRDKK